jgi:hypothetical protein
MPLEHDSKADAGDLAGPAAGAPGKKARTTNLAGARKPDADPAGAEAESIPNKPGTNPAPSLVVETHVGDEEHHLMLEVRDDGEIDVMMHSYPQYLATYLPQLAAEIAKVGDADQRGAAEATLKQLSELVEKIQKIAKAKGGDAAKFKLIEPELKHAAALLKKIPAQTGGTVKSAVPSTKVEFEPRSWGSRVACGVVAAQILSLDPGNSHGSPPSDEGTWGDLHGKHPSLYRGHMLNKHLHGPGIAENLAPITHELNDKMSSTFEEYLKQEILDKRQVYNYQAKVNYGASKVEGYTDDELGKLPASIDVQFMPLAKTPGATGANAADWKQAAPATKLHFDHALVPTKEEKGLGGQLFRNLVGQAIDDPEMKVKGKTAKKALATAKGQKKITDHFAPRPAASDDEADGAGSDEERQYLTHADIQQAVASGQAYAGDLSQHSTFTFEPHAKSDASPDED